MIEFKCMKKNVSIRRVYLLLHTTHTAHTNRFELRKASRSDANKPKMKWRKIKRINEIKTNFKIEQACVQHFAREFITHFHKRYGFPCGLCADISK